MYERRFRVIRALFSFPPVYADFCSALRYHANKQEVEKKRGAIVLNVVFLVRLYEPHCAILFKAAPVGGGVNKEMRRPSCLLP